MKAEIVGRTVVLTFLAGAVVNQLAPAALGIGLHDQAKAKSYEHKTGEAHGHGKSASHEHRKAGPHEHRKAADPKTQQGANHNSTGAGSPEPRHAKSHGGRQHGAIEDETGGRQEKRRSDAHKSSKGEPHQHEHGASHESKTGEVHGDGKVKTHEHGRTPSYDHRKSQRRALPNVGGFGEKNVHHAGHPRSRPTAHDGTTHAAKTNHGSLPGFPTAKPSTEHGDKASKSSDSSDSNAHGGLADTHGPARQPASDHSEHHTAHAGTEDPAKLDSAQHDRSELSHKHLNQGRSRALPSSHALHHPTWSDLSPETKKNIDNVNSQIKNAVRSSDSQSSQVSNWINRHPERVQKWQERGEQVRGNWHRHDHPLAKEQGPLSKDWRRKVHLGSWHYHHIWHNHRWQYWWATPSWAALCTQFPAWAHMEPMFYDYGPGGNVVYQHEHVDVNGKDVGTAAQYAHSAAFLATVDPQAGESPPSDDTWTALGTFAMETSEQDTTSTRLLQLAVDQNGIISGTLHNTSTKESHLVQGRVDQQTQRVAFTIGDKSDVVLETGIYNLTQPQAPVLVHFRPDHTEHYLLVRLDPPQEPEDGDGSKDAGTVQISSPLDK